jgi:D-amino peptidase
MRNLLPEVLGRRAALISGSPKPLAMMAGLDDSFDAVMCVGYHGCAGTLGVLDHTIHGRVVYDIRINGKSQGELGLNAGIASHFGVPIVLVAGDTTTAAQAAELIPDVETAAVKESLTRYSAKNMSPSAAQALIRRQATRAFERRIKIAPTRYAMPVTLTLQVMNSGMADIAEIIPGVNRTDPVTVEYTSDDFLEAFRCLYAMIMIAGAGG